MSKPIKEAIKNFNFLMYTFFSGLFYFIFFTVGISLGAGLAITLIGIPIVVAVLRQAPRFLHQDVKVAQTFMRDSSIGTGSYNASHTFKSSSINSEENMLDVLRNGTYWRQVLMLLSKLAIGMFSLLAGVLLYIAPIILILAPFTYKFTTISLLFFTVDNLLEALIVSAGGCLFLILSLSLGKALVGKINRYTHWAARG